MKTVPRLLMAFIILLTVAAAVLTSFYDPNSDPGHGGTVLLTEAQHGNIDALYGGKGQLYIRCGTTLLATDGTAAPSPICQLPEGQWFWDREAEQLCALTDPRTLTTLDTASGIMSTRALQPMEIQTPMHPLAVENGHLFTGIDNMELTRIIYPAGTTAVFTGKFFFSGGAVADFSGRYLDSWDNYLLTQNGSLLICSNYVTGQELWVRNVDDYFSGDIRAVFCGLRIFLYDTNRHRLYIINNFPDGCQLYPQEIHSGTMLAMTDWDNAIAYAQPGRKGLAFSVHAPAWDSQLYWSAAPYNVNKKVQLAMVGSTMCCAVEGSREILVLPLSSK